MSDIEDKVQAQEVQLAVLTTEVTALTKKVDELVTELAPLKETLAKGKGVMAAVGIAGGVIALVIETFVRKLFGLG